MRCAFLPWAISLVCVCRGAVALNLAPSPDPGGGPPPIVTTLTASAVTGTGGQLNGQVNPQGAAATAWFEWGLTSGYGNATPTQALGSGTAATNFQSVLGGLTSGVTYHYRALATNIFGLGVGLDQTFTASPPFTNVSVAGLPAVSAGAVSWADYDDDGRLDFLLTGSTGSNAISQLWRNTGDGFTNVPVAGLPGVERSAIAWADYDNDGQPDFLITGANGSNAVAQLWRNTGAGFIPVAIPGLPAVERGAVAWGDYDNDGRLDFLITGASGSNGVAELWRNTGLGFSPVSIAGLPGVLNSAVEWADYDNDGRLDFLLTGLHESQYVSQLWHNTGSGFTNFPIAGLPGVSSGRVCWGDYDNDGRLDFLLAGFTGSIRVSQLWRNTGNGFTNAPIAGLPGIERGTIAWGDYDNDGRLDFVFSGFNGSARIAQLWRNTGSGFAKVPNQILPGVDASAFAWGDYDNDGRLDFLLTGSSATGPVAQLWHSTVPATNVPPSAPSGLDAQVSGTSVTLSWAAASDGQTSSNGLSYNLVLATGSNGVDVASPIADLATGLRRVVRLGGASQTRSWTFANLPPAPVYYWGVQAIDSAFAGGPFAPMQTFALETSLNLVCPSDLVLSNAPGQCLATNVAFAVLADGAPTPEVVCRLADRVILSPASFSVGTNVVACTASNLAGVRACSFRVIVRDLEAPVVTRCPANIGPVVMDAGQCGATVSWTAPAATDNCDTPTILQTKGPASGSLFPAGTTEVEFTATDSKGNAVKCGFSVTVSADAQAPLITCPANQVIILPAGSSGGPVAFAVDASDNCGAGVVTTCVPASGSFFPVGTNTVNCAATDTAGNRRTCAFTVTVSSPPETSLNLVCPSDLVLSNTPGQCLASNVVFTVLAEGTPTPDVVCRLTNRVIRSPASFPLGTNVVTCTATNLAGSRTCSFRVIVRDLEAPVITCPIDQAFVLPFGSASAPVTFAAVATDNCDSAVAVTCTPASGSVFPAGTTPVHCTAVDDSGNSGSCTFRVTLGPPEFSLVVAVEPAVYFSAVAWGDFNGDGRLDVAMVGRVAAGGRTTQVLQNNGTNLASVSAAFPKLDQGAVAWGDFDNDGLPDLALSGSDGVSRFAQLWRSTGSGFVNIYAGLPGVVDGALAWGDYDNDGRLDLLLTGDTGSGRVAQVWRNTGRSFVDTYAGLPGVSSGAAAWGDFDGDGRLDLLLTGMDDGGTRVAQVWRNTGSGFVNIQAGLPGVANGGAAWGDYDNDGRLDIVLTGDTGSGVIAQVWRNTGAGFSNIHAALPPVDFSSVAWGDYDNDGWLDLLITGNSAGQFIAQVWRNTGTNFVGTPSGLPGVQHGAAAWVDWDNDGRLDVLLTGDAGTNSPVTKVWHNLNGSPNTPPGAPANLAATLGSGFVTFSWSAAPDAQTPGRALSYNVRVGTTPNGVDIVSPMSSATGLRRVLQPGNAGQALSLRLAVSPGQTYYWSVQAVDGGWGGGPFAATQSFLALAPYLTDLAVTGDGAFRFTFTNTVGWNLHVLVSPDVSLPDWDWDDLGPAAPLGGGLYEFTDPDAPFFPQRFYRVGPP